MRKIRAWAIKNKPRRGYVWRQEIRFFDPFKFALFRTQRDAWEFMKNQGLSIETHIPVLVYIDMNEA
jgi:hypothetical protein